MRKKFLALCRKLNLRLCLLYTWLLRSSLKRCGQGVRIHFPVRLENPESISLGDGVLMYPRTWMNAVSEWAGEKFDGKIQVGNRVMFSYGVQISAADLIVIEEDVAISAGAVIVDHIHDHRHPTLPVFQAPLSKPAPVFIGKGAFLGVHCFIGPGVHIGEHAVISANAVVVKDVPAYALAAGNPARSFRFHNAENSNATMADLSVERV